MVDATRQTLFSYRGGARAGPRHRSANTALYATFGARRRFIPGRRRSERKGRVGDDAFRDIAMQCSKRKRATTPIADITIGQLLRQQYCITRRLDDDTTASMTISKPARIARTAISTPHDDATRPYATRLNTRHRII